MNLNDVLSLIVVPYSPSSYLTCNNRIKIADEIIIENTRIKYVIPREMQNIKI
jgi:hypothetical protein